MSVVVTTGKFCSSGRDHRHGNAQGRGRGTGEHACQDRMRLQVTVGGRGRYGVRAILGPGRGARADQIPWDVVAGQAPMFLQLFFGPGQRVAVHDGPEHMPKLGLRRQLAELAFLGGEAVGVRPAPASASASVVSAARYSLLHRVQAGEKLAALLQGWRRPAPGR